jgi:hypothetical protein
MSQVSPGNGWLADPGGAPEFSLSPIVLYGQITGRKLDYLFRGDSLTARLPLEPPTTLVAHGSALVAQAFPGPGAEGEPNASPMMVSAYQYPNVSGAYHDLATTGTLDIDGTQSVAFSLCFRTTADAFPAFGGAIFGKRQAAGDLIGYELTMDAAGILTLTWKDATLTQTSLSFNAYNTAAGQHRYADGRLHTVDIEFDVVAGEVRIGTEHANTMTAAWAPASLATGTTFRLGAVRALAAGPFQLAYLAASIGQAAMRGAPSDTAFALAEETSLSALYGHNNEPVT